MNDNSTNIEQIRKMASGVKMAAFLSLATNIYEIYGFLHETTSFQKAIPIVIGVLGTMLIWQFARELQSQKKDALFYWIGLIGLGSFRLILSGTPFTWSVFSIVFLVVLAVVTLRLTVWTRNKLLG